jgi:hypothetical protein
MNDRAKVLLLVALVVLGIASMPLTTQALPINIGFEDDYYSDGSFSEVVGIHSQNCNSSPAWQGVRSNWVVDFAWDCNSSSQVVSEGCSTMVFYCPSGAVLVPGGDNYQCTCLTW